MPGEDESVINSETKPTFNMTDIKTYARYRSIEDSYMLFLQRDLNILALWETAKIFWHGLING